jgi:general secretion pathway protein G
MALEVDRSFTAAASDDDARNAHAGQRGFTLIELMIVVAIIAVLASILIPNFLNARAQAQTAACMANLNQIATSAELYYSDHNAYPAGSAIAVAPAAFTDSSTGVVYLNNTPRDPAASPTDVYSFTNLGTNAGYNIYCPPSAVHPSSTLLKLEGVSATTHRMTYVSGQGIQAAI